MLGISYELSIRGYRDMDLNDLALSITLMSKVLNDGIFEAGADKYQVKKEIIESVRNLLILASGILGSKKELLNRIVRADIGGLTTKSFTREPREGYKTPIIAYAKADLLNAVGLSNPGYKSIPDISLEEASLHLDEFDVLVIPGGKSPEYLRINEVALKIVRSMYREKKLIVSICHVPNSYKCWYTKKSEGYRSI